MNVTAPTVVRVAQQIMDDDADSLSLSSFGSRIRGDVPKTVMTGKLTTKSRNKQKKCSSVSTCPSTCSSSVVSLEGQDSYTSYTRGRGRKSKSSRTLEKEIIAHLREELAQVKAEAEEDLAQARAEAENSRALVQKLIVENEMIRQEVNDAHARADYFEEQVRQLSSPAAKLSATWSNVTQAIWSSQPEAQTKAGEEHTSNENYSAEGDLQRAKARNKGYLERRDRPTFHQNSKFVEVPIGEGDAAAQQSTVGGFRGMFQRASSARPTSSRSTGLERGGPKLNKLVTAEELLWDWDEGSVEDEEGDDDSIAPGACASVHSFRGVDGNNGSFRGINRNGGSSRSFNGSDGSSRSMNGNDSLRGMNGNNCSLRSMIANNGQRDELTPWDVEDCVSIASSTK